ncbi:MAG: ATP-binding protein [Sphaerochaetaceae bacterium]|jgi:hypothetical protein
MHATVSDFVSDIVQNSIESGASQIGVSIAEDRDELVVTVSDNGKGMSEEVLQRVSDPFHTEAGKHDNRKVGLGIPFLIQAVEAVGGQFSIETEVGRGTTVLFSFMTNHIDCPPLGSIVMAIVSMLAFDGPYQMIVTRSKEHEHGTSEYEIDRHELLEVLGDFSLSGNLQLLKTYVDSQESALHEQGI